MKIQMIEREARAFTLIELLLVVVIMGLLAAFVVPYFGGIHDKVKHDLTQTAIDGSLTTALDLYHTRMGRYPTTEEGLRALLEPPVDAEQAKQWLQCLKDAKGLKDQWDREYRYACPGEFNRDGFDLSSDGEDGLPGTDDDLTNWQKVP